MIIHFFEISVEPGHDPAWNNYDGIKALVSDQHVPITFPGIGVGHVDCEPCHDKFVILSLVDNVSSNGVDVSMSADVAEQVALDMLKRVALLRGTPAS